MIDRKQVLDEYAPTLFSPDPTSPLSLGNGDFCFTCDPTGLQTFPELYQNSGIPLCTMANWGWHSYPYSASHPAVQRCEVQPNMYFNGKRDVPYLIKPGEGENRAKYEWLRLNPHKFSLARIGFALPDGCGDIEYKGQRLDLWRGAITSRFALGGVDVLVRTAVDPDSDTLAVLVESALLRRGLRVAVEFPYPSHKPSGADFTRPEAHMTTLYRTSTRRADIARQMDADRYFAAITSADIIYVKKTGAHRIEVSSDASVLNICVSFSNKALPRTMPRPGDVFVTSEVRWHDYWMHGGFVHIKNGGDDGRELQRRIVLSQYLTAIQCGGSLPPAETGLTSNSWNGKFHMEMHWWHSAHFAFWGRPKYLENSLWYYQAILPRARALAAEQGYAGARWPKMTDPSGVDSPSPIGPLLIWQQPHPIYYAEALYRALGQPREVLERYRDMVVATAEFMADYVRWDAARGEYLLGPALIPSQENHEPEIVVNPTFELEYWRFGLRAACEWLRRLGEEPCPEWAEIAEHMAKPAVRDGVYLTHENCPDTYAPPFNRDHPSFVAGFGVLPGTLFDKETMRATYRRVLSDWQLDSETWGWDFPMLAMTATRIGLGGEAARMLLYPAAKNAYPACGHNKQADRTDLPLYLPGNGGLLTAVAMMCAGTVDAPANCPGFPDDWDVEWESIQSVL